MKNSNPRNFGAALWWAAVVVAALIPRSAGAAAANDAFAAAASLGPALPIQVDATNDTATVEPGEPQPESTGATLWWRWTPTSSGWVTITTLGEGIDTVLGVYRGDALAGLERLAYNDDHGLFAEHTGASQVVFFTEAGTSYGIQAGGYENWQGAFAFRLESTPPPPVLEALSLTPSNVDITSQSASVTAELRLRHPAGWREGSLYLVRPDGRLEADALVTAAARVSGTETGGTYRVPLFVRRLVIPGEFRLELEAKGGDGVMAQYGERTPFPPGVIPFLTVVNQATADGQPPVVIALSPDVTLPDATVQSQTVTFTVRLEDRGIGMVDFASVLRVWTPGGAEYASAPLSRRNRVAGGVFDATYAVPVRFPAGVTAGVYRVELSVADELGNSAVYGSDAGRGQVPFPTGAVAHVTVLNSAGADVEPPALVSAVVSPTPVNVATAQAMNLRVTARDARSGVEEVELTGALAGVRPVSGGTVTEIDVGLQRVRGTASEGDWEGQVILPQTLPAGEYLVVGLRLTDALGNRVTYGAADLGGVPYPGDVRPVVTVIRDSSAGPYGVWLARYPGLQGAQAARTADPDTDGLSNLTELALGTDPLVNSRPGGADPAASRAPRFYRQGNRYYFDYTVVYTNLGSGPNAIQVYPEESFNLRTWDGAQILILGEGAASALLNASRGAGFLRLVVVDPAQ